MPFPANSVWHFGEIIRRWPRLNHFSQRQNLKTGSFLKTQTISRSSGNNLSLNTFTELSSWVILVLALLHCCLLRLSRLFLSFASSASLRFVSNNNLQCEYSFQFLFGLLGWPGIGSHVSIPPCMVQSSPYIRGLFPQHTYGRISRDGKSFSELRDPDSYSGKGSQHCVQQILWSWCRCLS